MTPPLITSLHNPRVKAAAQLRDRKGRRQQGRIIVDGWREIERAAAAGVELGELFVCPELLDSARLALLERGELSAGEVLHVTPGVFARLAFGGRAEGVVAVAGTPARTLEQLQLPDDGFVVVLESVEKPGNLGAVARSADGAGVDALIVAGRDAEIFNPNAIRASLGVLFSLPTATAEPADVRNWLYAGGFRILAARVDGAIDYTAATYTGRTALVLGSEAEGLSEVWRGDDVVAVRLPMCGQADSLNVSATAAVLCYEALRQRRAGPRRR